MSGWNYPQDSSRGPRDGPTQEPDQPSWSDISPEEQFADSRRGYPRGYAPPWRGEDDPSPHDPFYTVEKEPNPDHLHNPGFVEREVDTHVDPDHGREDHRVGAVLRQADQWPGRVADYQAQEGHYDDYDQWLNDIEHQVGHEEGHSRS